MRLFFEEFYKTATNRILCFCVLGLLFVNGVFCLYTFRDDRPDDYIGASSLVGAQEIVDNAYSILESSLSKHASKFSIRNQQKIIIDYSKQVNRPTIDTVPAKGIMALINNKVSDFLCLVLSLMVVIFLLTKEREQGELLFYKSTYKGHIELVLAKLKVLMAWTVSIWTCFILVNYLIANWMYGFGDLSRPIQSIAIFYESIIVIDVKEFLILFFVFKLLNGILFSSLFYFFAVLLKRNYFLYAACIGLFSIEIAMNSFIEANSIFNFLKYINLYGFMNTGEIFMYRNINVAGAPISYISVYIFVVLVEIVFLCWGSVLIFNAQSEQKKDITIHNKKLFPTFLLKSNSLIMNEIYKLLINGKGLFIIVLFITAMYLSYKPIWQQFYIVVDKYYEAYIDVLEGPITQEKLDYLEKENFRYESLLEEDADEDTLEGYESFKWIYMQKLPYLKENDGHFIHETGYKILSGDGLYGYKDIQMAFFACLVLLYLYSYLYGIEYENETDTLLRTSYNGGAKTRWIKVCIGIVVTIVVYSVVYAPLYFDVYKWYGFSGINSPANSLVNLEKLPHSVTLLHYLIMVAVIRFIGYLCIMLMVMAISRYTKSVILNCGVCIIVVFLPLAFVFVGVPGAKYILFNPLILGNVF